MIYEAVSKISRLAPLPERLPSFTYGVSKLAGWQFSLSPDIAKKPIGALSGFQLTWYYYSHSHFYARILGVTQLVGGALLLFRKTAVLGAAAMLPMIVFSHRGGGGVYGDHLRIHACAPLERAA